MLTLAIHILSLTAAPFANPVSDDAYATEIRAWQAARETKLTAENGWLSLAGRYPLKDGAGLFIIFKDETNGAETYAAGRFIDIEQAPEEGEFFTLDFNKAHNPPCAFSKFTTCPIPPRQNHLKIKIEAGERIRK